MTPLRPNPPEDLDEFWANLVGEAMDAPLDMSRSRESAPVGSSHHVETIRFRGTDGGERHGWFALPESSSRNLPAFLWIPPYGRWSMMPNEYGTRPGYASLSFNLHGEEAFHEEKYKPARGYFAEGVDSPDHYVFRRIAQDCIIALRLLHAQIEVDESRVAASGMSQGGGISIWLGAYTNLIKTVVADMPFIAGTEWIFEQKAIRYPLKELVDYAERTPLGKEQMLYTLSYFDTLNIATRCKLPTRLTLGEKDPAVKPEQVRAVYEALPGEKELEKLPGGHDWHPEMVEGTLRWFDQHLS
jgi:cephalosporin-C deacetylase